MMFLTEEQKLIRNVAREFAVTEIRPQINEIDAKDEWPQELFDKSAALGFRGLTLPQEYGGLGADVTTQCLVLEELSKESVTVAFLNMNLTAEMIANYAAEEIKQKYLPAFCRGEIFIAFALTEPEVGSDATNVQTTAVKDEDDFILNGSKTFITGSGHAAVFLVAARTEAGITFFLVDRNTPGFEAGSVYKKIGMHGSDTGEFFLRNCRVPASHMLGQEGKGMKLGLNMLEKGRIYIGAYALGAAQGAYEKALEYSKQRVQFGQPICSFQSVSNHLAEMATNLEAMRYLLYGTAKKADTGQSFAKESPMVKLFLTEKGLEVCDQALRVCAGMGTVHDFGLERPYRDLRIMMVGEGTSEIQKMIIARQILK